ncbi:PREDICTED: egg cell-secreted [Prunus dulcis]|uniref:PREDICTED: egg cell-secreted n=1 Tax=Prunus dulcis TaxID=3755 RepID=A0A5E4FIC0_PRUDU|nr:PREDICTED: egg cell-secreted [Prunus dulcis]
MRISISIVLLFVSSALLFNVGFGRHNPPYVTQFLHDRAAHAHPKTVSHAAQPKAVSRLWFYFGQPLTPPPPQAPAPPPQVPALPTWKPPTQEDYEKCWSSLTDIDRLVGDLMSAFFTGDYSRIGPDCCAAIDGIDQNCFGLMLDQFNNRYYVPAVRQSCADQHSPPKAPSKA